MKVLLSIKPEFAGKIFEGLKKFEYRRSIFKQPVDSVVVYVSAPISLVIGEFEIEEIIHSDVQELWENTKDHSGISKDFFDSYFKDKETGYAIRIGYSQKYEKPLPLFESFGVKPPQSFAYL